ncbi:hypothetical protein [Tropicimonas sp. IMCC34043]|uniref:hypothetical protein n=1 Tax=Tropicimonas sp. IMCC34043 TaxID=2248760 RepID=UPI000E263244|nr:hypothetical protein [Tropicimonas sp. IMCC34043]
MAELEVLHPHGREFDLFLYASVGEDRNGYGVTVLSALARLGLDPWKEAADLSALGQADACARLETQLSAFNDVPTLARNHTLVAEKLTRLLPQPLTRRASMLTGPAKFKAPAIPIWWIFAALIVLLVLARFYGLANPG